MRDAVGGVVNRLRIVANTGREALRSAVPDGALFRAVDLGRNPVRVTERTLNARGRDPPASSSWVVASVLIVTHI